MNLRKKVLLAITLTLIGLYTVLVVSSRQILLRGFAELEAHETTEHLQRALNAFKAKIDALKTTAEGYAAWDDTYQFITDHNRDYIDENYLPNSYLSNDLNATIFLDNDGQIVFERAFDPDTEQSVAVPQALKDQLVSGSSLLNHADPLSEIANVFSLPQGPILVISLPILNNAGEGPINGTMIWVQYLNDQQTTRLAETTRLNMSLEPLDAASLPADFEAAKSALLGQSDGSVFVNPLNEEHVAAYGLISGYDGQPSLMLKVENLRDIYMQGQDTVFYLSIALLVISVAFAVVVLILLEHHVLTRLDYLSASVLRIRTTDDLNTPVDIQGSDEIANLGHGLNTMLAALAQSRERLQQAHDQLEQRVQERTVSLVEANDQLQQEIAERQQVQRMLAQAHDQALEALRLKTQIVANISHDARTPLTTITLQAEMLQLERYGPATPRQHKAFNSVLLNAAQMLSSFNNLLKEAQLKSNNLDQAWIEFAPADLLNEVVAGIAPLAERRKLALQSHIAADIPDKVCGDPDHLKQILMNLLNNAIKFTEQGSVSVQVDRVDNSQWRIKVSDTGRGIPLEAQDKIFDAFWQVDGSITRDTNRGVGLGLSIVKQLVAAMNGSITVESRPDDGSTFTIVLPLSER